MLLVACVGIIMGRLKKGFTTLTMLINVKTFIAVFLTFQEYHYVISGERLLKKRKKIKFML